MDFASGKSHKKYHRVLTMWSVVILLSTIIILLLTREVLSNLHVFGNDVHHHHHKHPETLHKHYVYPVPMYYHEAPKPHIHPNPFHIDGEPPAEKVHRKVRPIPIGKKRKQKQQHRRRHRQPSALEIPIIHHHHPPEVITEPPIYHSALRKLLATPVASLAGDAPTRRRASSVVSAPGYGSASRPVLRSRPTILHQASGLGLRRTSNLDSAALNSVIESPVLSRPPIGSFSRLNNMPTLVNNGMYSQNYRVNNRPILLSSLLRQNPYRSSVISRDGSFDHLPIIEDESPVIYEPSFGSSIQEEHPFRVSSMRRNEHNIMELNDADEVMERPFLKNYQSKTLLGIDHKPLERPPFLDDEEGPPIFSFPKSKKSEIFMDEPFSMSGNSFEFIKEPKWSNKYKTSLRKSPIISDEDFLKYLKTDDSPIDHDIIMYDSTEKDGSIVMQNFESLQKHNSPFRKSSFIRDGELTESLYENEPTMEDEIHFMDDEDVPFKRSVRKNGNNSYHNSTRDLEHAESRNHAVVTDFPTDGRLMISSPHIKDQSIEHIAFDPTKETNIKPWDILLKKENDFMEKPPLSSNDHPNFVTPSIIMKDHIPFEKDVQFINTEPHKYINDPILKTRKTVFKDPFPRHRYFYGKSLNHSPDKHSDVEFPGVDRSKRYFQRDSDDFVDKLPHEMTDHVSFMDNHQSSKSSDELYTSEKDIIFHNPYKKQHRSSHYLKEDHSGSAADILDHSPFIQDKEVSTEMASSPRKESMAIKDAKFRATFSQEIFEDNTFPEDNEQNKRKTTYRIVKQHPVEKDITVKSKPLKLSYVKSNSLQIPLIADLPQPFKINKISASSVADKEKFQLNTIDSGQEKLKDQFKISRRKDDGPNMQPLKNSDVKKVDLKKVNFKNVDFKDVKLLTSHEESSSEGRVQYSPERD